MGARLALLALIAAAGSLQLARAQSCPLGPPCAFKCGATCGSAAKDLNATALATTSAKVEPMREVIARLLAVAQAQALATVETLNATQYPAQSAASGVGWDTTSAKSWTAGFFPGVLWQLYNLTGDATWRGAAQNWTRGLANMQREWALQHDFGFVYLPSFHEEFQATGSEAARRQLLAAAEASAWAFNPKTGSLRTFEGWEPPGGTSLNKQVVIIDFMMNIELLMVGAALGGPRSWLDAGPQDWVDMAVSHARQVAKNHIRPDNSTYHVVEYGPVTGAVNARYTYQGLAPNSTWARGQSWGMAGFAKMYRHTGKEEFLVAARRLADRWLDLLGEMEGPGRGGFIPNWDFNAAYEQELEGPTDTSAAAVASMALLTLSELQPGTDCARRYLCAATSTIRALAGRRFLAAPPPPRSGAGAAAVGAARGGPMLKHGTAARPLGIAIDRGLVYGDYYLLEAIEICRRLPGCLDA